MPNPRSRSDARRAPAVRAVSGLLLAAVLAAVALAVPAASAGPHAPVAARAGLDLAAAAARSWAPDAALIYVENDEDVDAWGAATRWGYLFVSPSLQKGRVYSIRDGRILVAENLEMKFEAPPVAPDWIDSGNAIGVADREAGRVFKRQQGGRLNTMLLMRGAFDEKAPDRTTWTLVYTAPGQPSLFVVVDAADARVLRTWRG